MPRPPVLSCLAVPRLGFPRREVSRLVVGATLLLAVVAATPVPSPVHVHAGAAAADGTVRWTPAVQQVTGAPGEPVAIDLALDNGGEHEVRAAVAVRAVTIDSVDGPRAGGRSDALRLAVDRIVVRPGDRGAFRAVAEIPARPRLVAVQARLDEDDSTGPLAFVLLAPAGGTTIPELSVDVTLVDGAAEVRVMNRSAFPALVDIAVAATSWGGPEDDIQIGDVLLPADGERTFEVELSAALGRRDAAVAVLPRGAPPDATVRASTAAWPPRAAWTLAGVVLILLAGGTAVGMWRRS